MKIYVIFMFFLFSVLLSQHAFGLVTIDDVDIETDTAHWDVDSDLSADSLSVSSTGVTMQKTDSSESRLYNFHRDSSSTIYNLSLLEFSDSLTSFQITTDGLTDARLHVYGTAINTVEVDNVVTPFTFTGSLNDILIGTGELVELFTTFGGGGGDSSSASQGGIPEQPSPTPASITPPEPVPSTSGGGGGGGGGGGSDIISNLRSSTLFSPENGLRLIGEELHIVPEQVVNSQIVIDSVFNQGYSITNISVGEFSNWNMQFPAIPFTVVTTEISSKILGFPLPVVFDRAVIDYQLTVPVRCDSLNGITQNCVDLTSYAIPITVELESGGQKYTVTGNIIADLREKAVDYALLINLLIGTVLIATLFGLIKLIRTKSKKRIKIKGLGKSKLDKAVEKALS